MYLYQHILVSSTAWWAAMYILRTERSKKGVHAADKTFYRRDWKLPMGGRKLPEATGSGSFWTSHTI